MIVNVVIGHEVVVAHCELNPIKIVWSQVKGVEQQEVCTVLYQHCYGHWYLFISF